MRSSLILALEYCGNTIQIWKQSDIDLLHHGWQSQIIKFSLLQISQISHLKQFGDILMRLLLTRLWKFVSLASGYRQSSNRLN